MNKTVDSIFPKNAEYIFAYYNIVENLTVRIKTIIRRDYLIANFRSTYGNNTEASLLLDFARKHMPEELSAIESGYNEVYEKRHQRIEERKTVFFGTEEDEGKRA